MCRRWSAWLVFWLGAAGAAAPRDVPLLFEARSATVVARGDRLSWELSASGALAAAVAGTRVAVRLAGAMPGLLPRPSEPYPAPLFDRTARGGRRGIPVAVFRGAGYAAVYPGVDLAYSGTRRRLEYRFAVSPYGCAACPRLAFDGVERMWLDPDGTLRAATSRGELRYAAPRAYQTGPAGSVAVEVRYQLRATGEAALVVGSYDSGRRLEIRASVSCATYLGGAEGDYAYALAVDAAGHLYMAGETASPDFPVAGALQKTLAGDRDVFITKLNASGTEVLYSTYIGGSERDTPRGIAVDAAGNAYVTGFTYSTDFPTTPGALRRTAHAPVEGFVLKLNPQGSALVYATYLGGTHVNSPAAIAVNGAGEAFLAGHTDSPDFPVTAAAPQKTFRGPFHDAFALRLNANGSALIYSTYLGGSNNDIATAVALAGDSLYVAGATESADFPALAPLLGYRGNLDAFVARFDGAGQLVFSTFLGGSGADQANAIAVDASGSVYIGGTTQSINFPVTAGAYAAQNRGGCDAFVSRLDAAGTSLLYSTLLGGSGDEQVRALALGSSGTLVAAGTTTSADYPVKWNEVSSFRGRQDGFITVLEFGGGTAMISGSRYFGGADDDVITAVAADAAGNVYITGWTIAGMTASAGAFQGSPSGGVEAWVASFPLPGLTLCTPAASAIPAPAWALAVPAAELTLTCSGETGGTPEAIDLQVTLSAALAASALPVLQSGAAPPIAAERSGNTTLLFRGVPVGGGTVVLRLTGIRIRGPLAAGTQVFASITATGRVTVADARPALVSVESSPVVLSALAYSRTAGQPGCTAPPAAWDFATTDAGAVLWFAVSGGTAGTVARAEWVAPNGQIDRTYTWPPLAIAGAACFWDVWPIAGAPAAALTGTWTTNLYWGGFLLGSAQFVLRGAPSKWLAWFHNGTRQVVVHFFQGTTDTGWAWLNSSGAPGWTCVGAADFDGNGVPDLVWMEDTTHQVVVHFFGGAQGTTDIGWAWLNSSGAPGWTCVGAADFDGNGVPDLVWMEDTTRQAVVHFFGGPGGTTDIGWAWLNSSGAPGWRIVAAL